MFVNIFKRHLLEEGKRKLDINKSDKIVNRWITIILITYIPVAFAISHLIKLFAISNIYEYYSIFFR